VAGCPFPLSPRESPRERDVFACLRSGWRKRGEGRDVNRLRRLRMVKALSKALPETHSRLGHQDAHSVGAVTLFRI
jgi:hypothetical protein